MNKALALKVWKLLESGHSLYAIEQEEGIPRRTGQRLKTAAERFNSKTDIHDIAASVGWSEKTVEKCRVWWREVTADQNQVDESRGYSDLIRESQRRHHLDLERALLYLKDYLEPVIGGIPDDLLKPWDPPEMDLIFVDNLLSHFEGTELPQNVKQATKEGLREPRREGAQVAIDLLREVLAGRRFGGQCRHCPNHLER